MKRRRVIGRSVPRGESIDKVTGRTVYAVDVNNRALALVSRNAEAVGAAGRIRPALPDDVPGELRFQVPRSCPSQRFV